MEKLLAQSEFLPRRTEGAQASSSRAGMAGGCARAKREPGQAGMAALGSPELSCYFTSSGCSVGPHCRVTPNQCSLQGEEKAGHTEGGIVLATRKLITCCPGSLSHTFLGTEDRFSRTLGENKNKQRFLFLKLS